MSTILIFLEYYSPFTLNGHVFFIRFLRVTLKFVKDFFAFIFAKKTYFMVKLLCMLGKSLKATIIASFSYNSFK